MTAQVDCDLLVVGLGPVGDVLAGLAKVHGLSVIAIDRSPSHFPLPRAAVFDHEIMRIFQMIGVASEIEPLCRVPDRYQFLTAEGEVLLDFPVVPVGPYGWAETYALHQPAVEEVLRRRLETLGVDVRLGVEFTGLMQTDEAVTVDVLTGDTPSQIRARYVVGCDGSWSPVRQALGAELADYQFDEPWLVLDTIIEEPGDLPIVCQQICDPKRPVTHMAMSGKRFRWEFMLKPDERAEDMLTDARIRELLAPWNCIDRIEIERKAVYRFHALVADRWRNGRVLLAGDSAHQMPPFAGQGMCSGIRDAANLAWKLAEVISGKADGALLDTYQEEREPHVKAIIETAIAMGKVVCILDEAAAEGRNREMLARKASGAQDVSVAYPSLVGRGFVSSPHAGELFPQFVSQSGRSDDILDLSAALIGHDLPACSGVKRLDLKSPQVAPYAAQFAKWLEQAGVEAVLLRPDRHIFGTGKPANLIKAWDDEKVTRRAFAVEPS